MEMCTLTLEHLGVIFTLPPGHTKITQNEYIQNGFLLTPLLLGLRDYQRSQECEKFVADTHENIMQRSSPLLFMGINGRSQPETRYSLLAV